MHESVKDYQPDDESEFGDNECDEPAKAKEPKSGEFKSSRSLDNEFVFEKEWAFNRMLTLESLLSARLLSASNSKNFVFARSSYSHQHGKECSTENRTDKSDKSFKSSCLNKTDKKQNNLLTEHKSYTDEPSKTRQINKTLENS